MCWACPAVDQLAVFSTSGWLVVFVGLAMSTFLCFIIENILIFCVFTMMHRMSSGAIMRAERVREPLCEPNFLCLIVLSITSGPRLKIS